MANLPLAEGLETLARRTKTASVAIHLVIGLGLATFIGEGLETFGAIDTNAIDPGPLTMLFAVVYIGFGIAFLASVVFVAMWIYRAHANLRAADIETEFSPGWAVGWYFVPIANLFKPFQAMRELWNASHMAPTDFGSDAPGDVKVWWGFFIVGNILANISTRMSGFGGEATQAGLGAGMLGTLFTIASAWHLLRIVRHVDRAQRSEVSAAEVFA